MTHFFWRSALVTLGLMAHHAFAQEKHSLKLNEGKVISSVGTVTFVYADDDRCPAGAQCLSPGRVYVLLWLELGAKKSLVTLHWGNGPAYDFGVGNKFFGTEFCFVDLQPRPAWPRTAPNQVAPAQNREWLLTFTVKQSSTSVSTCPSAP
jgi:hypothetical protein